MRLAAAILLALATAAFGQALDPASIILLNELPNADGLVSEHQLFGDGGDSTGLGHTMYATGAVFDARVVIIPTNNARAVIGDAADLTPASLTCSFWIYPTYNNVPLGTARLICKEDTPSTRSYAISIANTIDLVTSSNGSAYSIYRTTGAATNLIPFNAWTHVAFSHEAGVTNRIYINGAQTDASYVSGGPVGALYDNVGYVSLGQAQRASVAGLDAKYADVRFYSRALAQSEIAEIYLKGPPQ